MKSSFARFATLLGAGAIGGTLAFYGSIRRANRAMLRAELPPFRALQPGDRLLILAPHPDDEALGAGGLMSTARAMGLAVRVVFLTNGDGSASTLRAKNARELRRTSFREFALQRQSEALRACARLGVAPSEVVFLGFPDGGCRALWDDFWDEARLYRSTYTGATRSPYANSRTPRAPFCGASLLRELCGTLRDFAPTLVLTTHPADAHADHAAAFAFAVAALETLRLSDTAPAWTRAARLHTFLIHLGIWPVPNGLHPDAPLVPPAVLRDAATWTSTDLTPDSRAAKLAAIEEYKSQLAVTPRYLRAFARRTELFDAHQAARDTLQTHAPLRDSPLHLLWPACDLHTLEVRLSPDGSLHLSVRPRAQPAPLLNYRVTLHAVAGQSPRLATLEFRASHGVWSAFWRGGNGRQMRLNTRLSDHELRCEVPPALRETLLPRGAQASLLVAAQVKLGRRVLDRVPLGVVRFGAENAALATHFSRR